MAKKQITVYGLGEDSKMVSINQYPDKCGKCHHKMLPSYMGARFTGFYSGYNYSNLEAAFQCTNVSCLSLLIGYYKLGKDNSFFLQRISPQSQVDKGFPEEVESISTNFVNIYNESYFAEQSGLMQIAGIGYRKSLEFLVKDYLIFLDNGTEDEIKNLFLGKCIDKIKNQNIKDIAKRATWLGNDEAHYVRKWEDKDINDLKKLIDITVHYTSMEIAAKKYIEEMI